MLLTVWSVVAAGCILAVGAVLALLGGRIFKFALVLLAFAFGTFAGVLLMRAWPWLLHSLPAPSNEFLGLSSGSFVLIVYPCALGLLCATLVLFLISVGVFVSGVVLGIVGVSVLLSLEDGGLITNSAARYSLLICLPLAFGVTAVCFERLFFVLVTSFVGAFCMISAVDAVAFPLAERSSSSRELWHMPSGVNAGGAFVRSLWSVLTDQTHDIAAEAIKSYVEAGVWVVLGLICVGVQLKFTAKDRHRGRKAEDGEKSPGLCSPRCACCSQAPDRKRKQQGYVLVVNE